MELANSNKVFHDRFPLEITDLTESEIKYVVLEYCASKGIPPPDEYNVKLKLKIKKVKNEKKVKKEKKSGRLPRRG